MQPIKQHPAETLQQLQRRFKLIFAIILPIAILAVMSVLLFLLYGQAIVNVWTWVIGVVGLGLVAVGSATFLVNKIFAKLQAAEGEALPSESLTAAKIEPSNMTTDPPPTIVLPATDSTTDNFFGLVEALPDGVIVLEGYNINLINRAAAIMLGATSAQQLVGQPITTFVPFNQQDLLKDQITSAANSRRRVGSNEQTFIRTDGSHLLVESKIFPVEFQNTAATGLIIRNINAHKQVELELTQRNRELTILQAAGLAITSRLDLRHVLDTVAKEMTRLLTVDSCTILEYSAEEGTILQIAEYGPKGWWDAASPAKTLYLADFPVTRAVLEEQIPEQMTINQPNADPTERAYMEEKQLQTRLLLPMVYQQQVVGLVDMGQNQVERTFTYQEISLSKHLANQAASAIEHAKLYRQAQQEIAERKRAEADLTEERSLLAQRVQERTEELSKVNAQLAKTAVLKDEFLASMSHELRTPLNAILGSSEILKTGVFGEVNEKQLKYLHYTEESGRHLLSLINDILDLSKIEAGKFDADIQRVSVKAIFEASLQLVKQLAHQKELTLLDTYDEDVTSIMGDERRVKQILVNLLSNAIKFTPKGGKVGLDVQGDPDQKLVHFVVWDTGVGIAPEDLERLFQPFVQVESDLSREYEGTGLGLSLVSGLAELHGGSVSVESNVGHGSRFTVSLPWQEEVTAPNAESAEREDQLTAQAPASPPIDLNDEKPLVLLADDNEQNINTFLDYLEIKAYRVVLARTGKEAIEQATRENPDIILMDIQMPEMDGLEATRWLRQNAQTEDIPIIAITALAMPGDEERCIAAGANKYLSKPLSPMQLVSTIEMCLHEAKLERAEQK